MASLLFRDKRRMSFSCSSSSSAAVCMSIDRRSIVRPLAGRPLDRHTPRLRDTQRTKQSQPSSNTKTKNQNYNKRSSERPTELISPVDSSRYLLKSSRYMLNDTNIIDVFPDHAPVPALAWKREDEAVVLRPSSTRSQDQVVVLRVSLHCKGCAGKVKKHISKMEGVTSFNIDLAAKKVTVVGDVTPLGVLNSISKVKNAQFWASPPRSSASF
ncbi:protein SODIUM POTASSIUM ROOT DEFECTIVE 2-like [Typha latifolia]|uniref:protein SODIUM POTASSIUM ROOT DEFECTIVE 2-like n=1 Tax=Typha latifolia TaxID=4733 RepID=UPI003C2F6B85